MLIFIHFLRKFHAGRFKVISLYYSKKFSIKEDLRSVCPSFQIIMVFLQSNQGVPRPMSSLLKEKLNLKLDCSRRADSAAGFLESRLSNDSIPKPASPTVSNIHMSRKTFLIGRLIDCYLMSIYKYFSYIHDKKIEV